MHNTILTQATNPGFNGGGRGGGDKGEVGAGRENKKKSPLLWDSLHFLITFLTHRCRNCTIPSSASLCMFDYFYTAFPEVTDNMLTVGNTQHLTQTLWECSMRTHFPRHSQWIYSPMYWEQTAICRSASETSRSILDKNVLKADNFCNFRFCCKQTMRTSWQ